MRGSWQLVGNTLSLQGAGSWLGAIQGEERPLVSAPGDVHTEMHGGGVLLDGQGREGPLIDIPILQLTSVRDLQFRRQRGDLIGRIGYGGWANAVRFRDLLIHECEGLLEIVNVGDALFDGLTIQSDLTWNGDTRPVVRIVAGNAHNPHPLRIRCLHMEDAQLEIHGFAEPIIEDAYLHASEIRVFGGVPRLEGHISVGVNGFVYADGRQVAVPRFPPAVKSPRRWWEFWK